MCFECSGNCFNCWNSSLPCPSVLYESYLEYLLFIIMRNVIDWTLHHQPIFRFLIEGWIAVYSPYFVNSWPWHVAQAKLTQQNTHMCFCLQSLPFILTLLTVKDSALRKTGGNPCRPAGCCVQSRQTLAWPIKSLHFCKQRKICQNAGFWLVNLVSLTEKF